MYKSGLLIVTALLVIAPAAFAQNGASDDFNRAAGTNMGPDWSEKEGDAIIENDMGRGNQAWMQGWMHHTFQGNYADSVQSVDFQATGVADYVALIAGLDPNTWGSVFVKIQDNSGDGLFDRVFFYSAINAGAWGSGSGVWYDLAYGTASGRMTLSFANNGDTAVCEIDNDTSGLVETFTASGILGFTYPITGSDFGIGWHNKPYFDNWSVELVSLTADVDTISAATGGTVDFTLDAGTSNAGRVYVLFGGKNGSTPGTPLPGGIVTLPLNRDGVTDFLIQRINTFLCTDFRGTLDQAGQGAARLNAAFTWPSFLVGSDLVFAYGLTKPWDFASNAVTVSVLP